MTTHPLAVGMEDDADAIDDDLTGDRAFVSILGRGYITTMLTREAGLGVPINYPEECEFSLSSTTVRQNTRILPEKRNANEREITVRRCSQQIIGKAPELES